MDEAEGKRRMNTPSPILGDSGSIDRTSQANASATITSDYLMSSKSVLSVVGNSESISDQHLFQSSLNCSSTLKDFLRNGINLDDEQLLSSRRHCASLIADAAANSFVDDKLLPPRRPSASIMADAASDAFVDVDLFDDVPSPILNGCGFI